MRKPNHVAVGAIALAVGATGLSMTQHALAVTSTSGSCTTKAACLQETNKGTTNGPAIAGISNTGSGLVGQSNTTAGYPYAGVYGSSSKGAWAGVIGQGTGMVHGVYGMSTDFPGVRADSGSATFFALEANSSVSGGEPFIATNTADGGQFSVDNHGNGSFTGLVFTAGACKSGCSRTHRITEYAQRSTTPTLEDNGEAAMRGGYVHVSFDRAFANVIDSTKNYLVTVTPEGDSKGVFVTNKGPNGFDVRENQGGRSNLLVTYRVVASTIGTTGQRLATIDLDRGSRLSPPIARP